MKTKAHTIYKLADGTRVGGVTTIVGVRDKPALIDWANKLGLAGIESRRFVDDKADIGTLAHEKVVAYLKGETVDTSDYSENQIKQADWACNSFFSWMKGKKVELIWAERPLVSEFYKFGGTPDIYGIINSKELLDLKTGSGIYDEHKIQIGGGYGILMNELGFDFERIRILNIPRANNENWCEVIIESDQLELYKKLFLCCLDMYNLNKQLKGEVVYAKKHDDLTPKKGK